MEKKKNLEVISGDGSSLDISPVYEHFKDCKPKSAKNKPSNIFIPKVKKNNDDNSKKK